MRCAGLFGPAAVANFCFTTQAFIPQRRATASGANVHSAALPQKATAGVEHPTLRVAALITAIGTKNTEPPGAGDTTETSLPPSEQSISRDDATAARRPLTTQHTGPRPRRHSFTQKSGPVTTPQMTSPNIYACGTHLLALAEDHPRHTLTPTPPTALTARYRYHGLLEHCEKIAGKGKRDEIADHRPRQRGKNDHNKTI